MRKYLNIGASAVVLPAVMLMTMAWGDARGADYLISVSPSVAGERSREVFTSLAKLLERVTGKTFEYRHPGRWPRYIRDMRDSKHGLLFDEPHLVSWRLENDAHDPLVRLSGGMTYVIVARRNDQTIVQLADLAGRIVCADLPPALDGLTLLEQFTNPNRQPQIRPTMDFHAAYQRLLDEGCRAAVLPLALYESLSDGRDNLRVLFLSESYPNRALSADRRIPQPVLDKIREALLDPDNAGVTGAIASEFDPGTRVLPASSGEYLGYSRLLKDFWGLR